MAHATQVKGEVSQLTTAIALLSNGWEVAKPYVDEAYDLVAKDPISKEFKTIQVKTIRRREDKGNEMVIKGVNGNKEPYTPDICHYMAGVEGDTVYLTECTGIKEYWASDASAAKRWIKFTADERIDPTEVKKLLEKETV
jgi:hypothetical protein